MSESIIRNKSYDFAIRIVRCTQFLQNDKKEFVLSKQLLRSGTSIGALLFEAEFAQSRPDFCHKMNVALKEANETKYWIMILKDTEYITQNMYDSLYRDCGELIAMLVSAVKNTRITKQKESNE